MDRKETGENSARRNSACRNRIGEQTSPEALGVFRETTAQVYVVTQVVGEIP